MLTVKKRFHRGKYLIEHPEGLFLVDTVIRVTPIETGKARMKVAQMTAAERRGPLERKIDIFRDTRWVEPLPIPDAQFVWPDAGRMPMPGRSQA
jgi:hypothetical protein